MKDSHFRQQKLNLTANCETLEQLGSRSNPAICLFCRQPNIRFNFSKPYLHTLTSPFPQITMVRGGHRRHIPEPFKGIIVTMSRQMSSKDILIRQTNTWLTPATGTELCYRFAISCSLYDGIIISAVGLRVPFKEFMFTANMRNVGIEVDRSSA